MVNGRKATITASADLVVTFPPPARACRIPAHEILYTVLGPSRVGIGLVLPTVVVPGTVKPVTSFLVTPRGDGDDWPEALACLSASMPNVIDHTLAETLRTACGRTEVQFSVPICAWTSRTCTVVQRVKAVVLQRTTGGMSTYDAHVIPACGHVVTIELLPHGSLVRWTEMYGEELVVNAGPDPVPLRRVQEAQLVPDVGAYILGLQPEECDGTLSGSDDSEWDGTSSGEEQEIDEETESISDCSPPATPESSSSDSSSSASESESSLELTDGSE